MAPPTQRDLQQEIEELRVRLDEAEQTLRAIRSGEVDSLVVDGPDGPRVYALEGANNSYRVLVEAMNEGAATLTKEGTVLYCNRRFAEILGLPLEKVMGASLRELVSSEQVDAFDALFRSGWEDGSSKGEIALHAPDGTATRVLLSTSAVADDEPALCIVAMDLTEQLRAQELRESARRKDEFLGMLSHELRNPLAPIRNAIFILEQAGTSTAQAENARAIIKRQTEHLTRLVEDLLDVTRIAQGKTELRWSRVDLREVVWHAADDFRAPMEERGVAFRVSVPDDGVWIEADSVRIAQVVGNLLHNASKFTGRGAQVVLALRTVDDYAEISVCDTGVGMDPNLVPRIFDAFFQGHRTLARTGGGLGLGLALVKGITELHGGKVHAESAGLGRGARFSVRLPLVGPANAGRVAIRTDERSSLRRHVLIVDDNADAAESLADVVRLLGHEVEVAYDGPGAIERARINRPDVILCDIGLPGLTGYDVARALRAGGPTDGMKIIAVSGYAQPEDVREAAEAGFDGHVAKPCDPAVIDRLLR